MFDVRLFASTVLIVFAFSQYVADSYWLHRAKQLRMSFLGRWNGVLYFAPLLLIGVWELQPQIGQYGLSLWCVF